MLYRFLLLGSVAALASCAYGIDTHIQDVKITTPGARGSVCYAYVDGLRYRLHPPQSISISNTKEDLVVDCLAPGNRRKEVVIEAEINNTTFLNVANGGVGVPWDAFSGAAYKYPDIIEVDFTNTPVMEEAPPAQNAPDIKQPEEYMLEEFHASRPMLNSDRNAPDVVIERRERGAGMVESKAYVDQTMSAPAAPYYYDKGNLEDVGGSDAATAVAPLVPLGLDPSLGASYGPPHNSGAATGEPVVIINE
ncbi:MAG: hypothetical protein KDJ35_01030 [Alphaproteobacteria bacterium]|nr:hypothetical protein [Alphaproteobacteria bacterium]